MIPLSAATRVFIVTGSTDMRKSFNGCLSGIEPGREAENSSETWVGEDACLTFGAKAGDE